MQEIPKEIFSLIFELIKNEHDIYSLLQVSTSTYEIMRVIVRRNFRHLSTTSNSLLLSMFSDIETLDAYNTPITWDTILKLTNLQSLRVDECTIELPRLTELCLIDELKAPISAFTNLKSLTYPGNGDDLSHLKLQKLYCTFASNLLLHKSITELDIGEHFYAPHLLEEMPLVKLSVRTNYQLPISSFSHLTYLKWHTNCEKVDVTSTSLRKLSLSHILDGFSCCLDTPEMRNLRVCHTENVDVVSILRMTNLEQLHWYSTQKPSYSNDLVTYDSEFNWNTTLSTQRKLKLSLTDLREIPSCVNNLQLSECAVYSGALRGVYLTKLSSILTDYRVDFHEFNSFTGLKELRTISDGFGNSLLHSFTNLTTLTSNNRTFTPKYRMNYHYFS